LNVQTNSDRKNRSSRLTGKPGRAARCAVATLELVLALPVLLVMLVAMVWLGYAVIGQAEVTVEARQDAWQQRFEPWSQAPFTFSQNQQATGDASTTVNVSPLLDGLGDPESEHTLEQANWDHRSVEYKSLPNWDLYVDVSVAAKREGLMSLYEDARSLLQSAGGQGSSALNLAQQFISEMLQSSRDIGSGGNAAEQRTDLDKQLAEQDIRGRIEDLNNQISQQKRLIDQLQDSDDEDAEDRLWLAKQKRKRLEISLKLVKSS
tara:strand:- start:241114 stop:241902 length:789 start_codon:yes stop_codon:yes gene_type:complete